MVLPRGLAPRASAFAKRRAELLHFGSENGASCRCWPGAVSLEETRARCYTNDANGKWWLRPVSRRTLLGFSEALIYLSYTASGPSAR